MQNVQYILRAALVNGLVLGPLPQLGVGHRVALRLGHVQLVDLFVQLGRLLRLAVLLRLDQAELEVFEVRLLLVVAFGVYQLFSIVPEVLQHAPVLKIREHPQLIQQLVLYLRLRAVIHDKKREHRAGLQPHEDFHLCEPREAHELPNQALYHVAHCESVCSF